MYHKMYQNGMLIEEWKKKQDYNFEVSIADLHFALVFKHVLSDT